MPFGYTETNRGFGLIVFPCQKYPGHGDARLVQESSAIGDYEDSLEKPGSSFLWVGEHAHLDRDDVEELIGALECWLETGRLPRSHGNPED